MIDQMTATTFNFSGVPAHKESTLVVALGETPDVWAPERSCVTVS